MHNRQPDTVTHFKETQAAFVAYIRNPEQQPIPTDVKKERMLMYRELLFNNVNTFISSNFPVLHQIIHADDWLALVQDFFHAHACTSPYFSEIPEEFLAYLQNERQPQAQDPAFMLELAHYEWVELALSIAEDELPETAGSVTEEVLAQKLMLSPLAWPLAYRFPVHSIAPEYQPQNSPEQPTFLVVYRDKQEEVQFTVVTPMTYTLLSLVQETPGLAAEEYIAKILIQNPDGDQETIRQGAIQIIQQFMLKTILCQHTVH